MLTKTRRSSSQTSTGRFIFHLMAALAEMERDLMQERTRAGLVAAKPPQGRAAADARAYPPQQVKMARACCARSSFNSGGSRGDV
jgi:DNA invertase Pin-like site-specific DNA recombinase